jgi:hypothetical protein
MSPFLTSKKLKTFSFLEEPKIKTDINITAKSKNITILFFLENFLKKDIFVNFY